MSTGFRLLLLILLGFGAVWIYRFRSPQLTFLLNPTRPVLGEPGYPTLDAGDIARGHLEPPVRPGWEGVGSPNWDPEADAWAPDRLAEKPWRANEPSTLTAEYESIEHDPDLISGAFEEASGEVLPSVYDETQPRGDGEEIEDAPFGEPPAEPAPGTVEIEYVVQERDSLWSLAERFLGAGHRNGEIVRLNSLASETLVPGMKLRLKVPEHRVPEESLKSPRAADDKSVEASSGPDGNSLILKTHKVKAGETLSEIASRYLPGNPRRAEALVFEANRDTVSSPDRIREGQILVIPPRR